VTPLSRAKESLKSLHTKSCPDFIIDARFTSPIQMFRNLVSLNVGTSCHYPNDDNRCASKLDNDDVTELTISLPKLKSLFLGGLCTENTCVTTAACLLQISVHCLRLRDLEIHFNTTNIVDDLKMISGDPRFQELRSLPKCTLLFFDAFSMPLALDEPGFKAVINGMTNIFPCLEYCVGSDPAWIELSERLVRLRRT